MAINRRKGSVPERILQSELFRSGEHFTTPEMARTVGATSNAVTAACATLRALGHLTTTGFSHRRIVPGELTRRALRTRYFAWEPPLIGPREWGPRSAQ